MNFQYVHNILLHFQMLVKYFLYKSFHDNGKVDQNLEREEFEQYETDKALTVWILQACMRFQTQ